MKKIVVVGLGPGSWEGITLRAWEFLSTEKRIFLRTAEHPLVKELVERGIEFTTFDNWYERSETFEEAYQGMVDELIRVFEHEIEEDGRLVFAVPGHPMVAERAVQMLMERVGRDRLLVVPGMSAVDAVCAALGVDPTKGLCILDALNIDRLGPDPRLSNLILQVHHPLVASEVKLELMESYPDDYSIQVVRAAGVPGEERVHTIPLFELDRLEDIDHLTSVYLPPLDETAGNGCAFPLDPLVKVMDRLLAPDGCPWDREQDHHSLRPYLIEETYEVIEALDEQDMEKLEEELGDLLLQIVFHAALAHRNEYFDINDVILKITRKMVHRHPHVFGDTKVKSSGEVLANWEKIKRGEGSKAKETKSYMEGITPSLPALLKANKAQAKAARVGFDWPSIDGPWEKVKEEVEELKGAERQGDQGLIEEEVGDLLFAVVNVARFLKVDPETALSRTVSKFVERFRYIENKGLSQGRDVSQMTLEEMDAWWEDAKKNGR